MKVLKQLVSWRLPAMLGLASMLLGAVWLSQAPAVADILGKDDYKCYPALIGCPNSSLCSNPNWVGYYCEKPNSRAGDCVQENGYTCYDRGAYDCGKQIDCIFGFLGIYCGSNNICN